MIAIGKPANLLVLEELYAEAPALFEKLLIVLARRPQFGEVVLRFRDGKIFIVERHEQFR